VVLLLSIRLLVLRVIVNAGRFALVRRLCGYLVAASKLCHG
jgi:hypothetical protein